VPGRILHISEIVELYSGLLTYKIRIKGKRTLAREEEY
jgi:hypothetical protein